MNIILEGLDASGKSTLARKLQSKYQWPIKKKGTGYFHEYLDFVPNTIYDRHFISEWVFPQIYNRDRKFNEGDFKFLVELAKACKSIIIIFVCSEMGIIYHRLSERGEFNEYFKEMTDQQYYFTQCIDTLLKNYPYLYVIDIAKENAYADLDNWLDNKINELKEN